ncbi:hypothetical protein [Streptomyces sp. NPDC046631]|uniref:hypothetical protein n=1 Tax=unclassified Streptomyces TaxID=2593676 RepID=UPI0033D19537
MAGKYRKTVLGDTSAAAAICSTVVASYPCSAIRRWAAPRIAIRVRSFFRSRSPGRGGGAGAETEGVREVAAMAVIVRHRRAAGTVRERCSAGRPELPGTAGNGAQRWL